MAATPEVIPENTISVLDHGFVRLDDAMASDLSVVNAARVSFARRKETMEDADAGLIRFLMRERHGTPFEHNAFRFHIRAPIFVAREWFRHRIGSFNEFSMRYAKATDEFYVPAAEDVRSQAEIDEAVEAVDVKDPELELARQLIDSLVGDWEPEALQSEYRQDLRKLLEAKLAGEEIAVPEPVADAPVVDLMEALKKSVAASQKRDGAKPAARKKAAPRKRAAAR